MGKSRNSGSREVEYLRGEVKKLQKRLKAAQKYNRVIEDKLDDDSEPVIKELPKKKDTCPTCDDGSLSMLDLGVAQYVVCNSCNFRQKVENGEESKK